MRYSASHKEQTRQRLIESSGAIAKRGGFATTGVDGLMKAIGLTGGAFYSHFPSKGDLFTEVVRRELSQSPILARDGVAERTRLDARLAHLFRHQDGALAGRLRARLLAYRLEAV